MRRRRNDALCVVMVVLCLAALFLAWMLLIKELQRAAPRLQTPARPAESIQVELPEPSEPVDTAAAPAEDRAAVPLEAQKADEPAYDPAVPLDEDLQYILIDACEANGVGYPLALGIIEVESGFDPAADNGLCYGLCQLSRRYFPSGLPPGENIREGMEYLGWLLRKYDSPYSALTAYNAGYDNGDRDYAQRVLTAAGKWGVE